MPNGEHVSIGSEKFGWLRVSGQNVGLIFTVFGFVVTCLVAALLFLHGQDARDGRGEIVEVIKTQTIAVKEQAIAARELNCIISLPQEQRQPQAEFCKRISR